MKRLFAILLLLPLHIPALAETVELGDATIPYAAPAGFARADGLYPLDLSGLDQEFDLHSIVFAQYVPAADIPVRQNDPRAIPSWYVHLAYDDEYSRYTLNEWLFAIVAFFIDKSLVRQYDKPTFTRKLESVIGGALRRKITIEAMTQKGFVDKKTTLRSMLAHGQGLVESNNGDNGKMERYVMACMTTFYLREGRWLTILQGARLQSEADLPAFTTRALRIVAEITQGKNAP
ncbi:MAG: hypothetical protein LBQ81_00800 [Zoogloeaceae bacterium]|jgi:hypothetical protein|nr:hypothetical protein [Zoogloeaceae bacterium]